MDKGAPKGFSQGDIDQIAQTQAKYNRINQRTPYGTLDDSPSGDTAYVRLAPAEQKRLDQERLMQRLAGETAIDRLGIWGDGRERVEQAHFDRALSLLNPEFDRREGAMQQRLANQGLPQTSGAYNREYGRFETGVNQQLEQAALASVLAGGQEESRELNQILALMGNSGQVQQPQFINPSPITIPVNQPQGGGGDPLSLILGLGGAGLGAFLAPPGLGPYGAASGFQIGTGAGQTFRGY